MMKTASWFCVLAFCVTAVFAGQTRQPAVAGRFYPADPAELRDMADGFLAKASAGKLPGKASAFLVPHAGYIFSGQTAAYSYSLLPKDTEVVIIIGNSHYFPLVRAAVYPSGGFETPLGTVAVNDAFTRALLARRDLFEENTAAHGPEHSIEVQLPFLQRTLKNFTVVPILVGQMPLERCARTGEAIASTIKALGLSGKAMIIVSSDLTHYPSRTNAELIDNAALNALKECDAPKMQALVSRFMQGKVMNLACVFCGEEALYSTIYASRMLGADKAVILSHATSADGTGDPSRAVGYGAAALVKSSGLKEPSKERPMKIFSISEKNRKELLALARQSIVEYLRTESMPAYSTGDPELTRPAAVFVTLTEHGDLRGCIGTTEPQEALHEAVSRMAIAAATQDYRFSPVRESELKDIRIEISVLSPMQKAKSHDEIESGTHGVLVCQGRCSGLFLPQVWEQLANKEDFMNELCRQKAGIEPTAWKTGRCDLYTFTVFSFEENK